MGPKRMYVEEVSDGGDDENNEIPPVVYAEVGATPATANIFATVPVPSILRKKRKEGEGEEEEPTERSVQFSPTSPGDNPHGYLEPQIIPESPLGSTPGPPPESTISPPPPPPSPTSPPPNRIIDMGEIEYTRSTQYWHPSNRRYTQVDKSKNSVRKVNSSQGEARDRFGHDPKPALPRTAIEFMRRYKELTDLAKQWAQTYFPLEIGAPRMSIGEMKKLGEGSPLLVRWIDSIASAPCGHNWLTLFSTARHLLVMGVLGKVLEDRVFKKECFGGSEEEQQVLRLLDEQLETTEFDELGMGIRAKVPTDAFTRQKLRAVIINTGLHRPRDLPERFAVEVKGLYDQLVELFRPLLLTNEEEVPDRQYYVHLDMIVALAGKLSLDMRREPDTVYYVAITPPRYRGLDVERMSPVIFGEEEEAENVKDFDHYTNVISVWPGVFAYRRPTDYSTTIQIIHRALIYTRPIELLFHDDQVVEQNPENILTISQLWEYLRLLGVSNTGDGREWGSEHPTDM